MHGNNISTQYTCIYAISTQCAIYIYAMCNTRLNLFQCTILNSRDKDNIYAAGPEEVLMPNIEPIKSWFEEMYFIQIQLEQARCSARNLGDNCHSAPQSTH